MIFVFFFFFLVIFIVLFCELYSLDRCVVSQSKLGGDPDSGLSGECHVTAGPLTRFERAIREEARRVRSPDSGREPLARPRNELPREASVSRCLSRPERRINEPVTLDD